MVLMHWERNYQLFDQKPINHLLSELLSLSRFTYRRRNNYMILSIFEISGLKTCLRLGDMLHLVLPPSPLSSSVSLSLIVCLSLSLSICLFVYISLSLSVCQSVCQSVSVCLSVCQSLSCLVATVYALHFSFKLYIQYV